MLEGLGGPFRLVKHSVFGHFRVLGCFFGVLGGFFRVLGRLGPSWGRSWPSWGRLETVVGGSQKGPGGVLGLFWVVREASDAPFGANS